jgi:small subunit ribosomal protein S17
MVSQNKIRKRFTGTVVSAKMTKAVVVEVLRSVPHPKYKKVVKMKKRFYARTENPLKEGDIVVIEESRPLSKLIRWMVVEKKS